MAEVVNWRELGDAVEEQRKHPGSDALAPYREALYDNQQIPWGRYTAVQSAWNVGALLRSMARTFTDEHQLETLFRTMDQARSLGHMPTATSDAGDALMDRAHGKRGYPPLPADWASVAERALSGGKNSSGVYWAAAMLRAGGHHVTEQDRGHEGLGCGFGLTMSA